MRFRTGWIWVALVCLIVSWVLRSVKPACSFDDIARALGVVDVREYGMLACLGILVTALVAILRVLRRDRDDDA